MSGGGGDGGDDAFAGIAAEINSGITELNLSVDHQTTEIQISLFNFPSTGANIGDRGAGFIGELLKTNTTILRLGLKGY